jgi:hypothetical protein
VTVDIARSLDVPNLMLVVNKAVPGYDYEDLKSQIESAYQAPLACILPLNFELADNASKDLFSLKYPQHPWSRNCASNGSHLIGPIIALGFHERLPDLLMAHAPIHNPKKFFGIFRGARIWGSSVVRIPQIRPPFTVESWRTDFPGTLRSIIGVKMKCWHCEEPARAACVFCGRFVCKDHFKPMSTFVAMFLGSTETPKGTGCRKCDLVRRMRAAARTNSHA